MTEKNEVINSIFSSAFVSVQTLPFCSHLCSHLLPIASPPPPPLSVGTYARCWLVASQNKMGPGRDEDAERRRELSGRPGGNGPRAGVEQERVRGAGEEPYRANGALLSRCLLARTAPVVSTCLKSANSCRRLNGDEPRDHRLLVAFYIRGPAYVDLSFCRVTPSSLGSRSKFLATESLPSYFE